MKEGEVNSNLGGIELAFTEIKRDGKRVASGGIGNSQELDLGC